MHILADVESAGENVRAAAGLLLKKYVLSGFGSLSGDTQDYIRSQVVGVIGDPHTLIQATAGVLIATIVYALGIEGWPELLEGLAGMLDSGDESDVVGALSVFRKLCEDYPYDIHKFQNGMALSFLIPKWMGFFTHSEGKVRRNALACVIAFIEMRSAGFLAVAEDFVEGLYMLATDEFVPVRRLVCDAMVQMLQVRADLFLDKMDAVVDYMLVCSASDDELLALEACEFWASFAEAAVAEERIRPVLGPLIPVLLKNMIYSEYDLVMLGGFEDDSHLPDLSKDIAPRFHSASVRSKAHIAHSDDDEEDGHDYGDDSGSDDEEGDMGSAQYSAEWNLRKSAAAAMDVLGGVYKEDLLEYVMPVISEMMNSSEWEEREAAILAMGAISIGCGPGLAEYLPDVVEHLIVSSLQDSVPLIRKISCWTLSRYAEWIVLLDDPEAYLFPYVRAILARILDKNKQVQEAACSAMAVLSEKASTSLVTLFGEIIETYTTAMETFQVRSLRLLYDAVGALAENTNKELKEDEYASVLLPPLMEKWEEVSLEDPSLFPLMEALTSVSSAVSLHFLPYAPKVFYQCAELISGVLNAWAEPEPGVELPSKEFLVCALDLLSGVVDAVGEEIEPLVLETKMLDMVAVCIRDPVPDVRQSSFALVGDLSKAVIHVVAEYLEDFLPVLIENLDPKLSMVCNNVAWSIGEIAMQVGDALAPYLEDILGRLIAIMNRPRTSRSLLENTAIALGRIGLQNTELVAPSLDEFVAPWCMSLRSIFDDPEKESAFRGLCHMIAANPDGAVESFPLICDGIASWKFPPDDLKDMFSTILDSFKSSMDPVEWVEYYADFSPDIKDVLFNEYHFN